jgi:hypothetical protein
VNAEFLNKIMELGGGGLGKSRANTLLSNRRASPFRAVQYDNVGQPASRKQRHDLAESDPTAHNVSIPCALAYQYAPLGIVYGIAGMYADTAEVRNINQQGEGSPKARAVCHVYLIGTLRDTCLPGDLHSRRRAVCVF